MHDKAGSEAVINSARRAGKEAGTQPVRLCSQTQIKARGLDLTVLDIRRNNTSGGDQCGKVKIGQDTGRGHDANATHEGG
ncbi:hypothetical protein GCM10007420_13120 [Glycocaulis albus]|uniref:Uncharacterized protein n=1 Tax=Glycocaulis albus TaxID=1382801 RepID=A0ABQ1XNR4_9PROT|nr:hypothetical protein GCM10007420_13120 [Glycocaulis albus]